MIKEAIDRVLSLAPANVTTIGARQYADKQLTPIQSPIVAAIEVSTLGGLGDLIANDFESFPKDGVIVHVVDHEEVALVSNESDDWGRRVEYVSVNLTETRGFAFGSFLDHEQFVIGVQANFTESGDREYVLKMASNLTQERVSTSQDDGISQQVGVRAGVALKATETLRARVNLAPYRTFREVDQPVSEFVFRVQQNGDGIPRLALFEADGGRWKLTAIENVARFLRTIVKDIPVVS